MNELPLDLFVSWSELSVPYRYRMYWPVHTVPLLKWNKYIIVPFAFYSVQYHPVLFVSSCFACFAQNLMFRSVHNFLFYLVLFAPLLVVFELLLLYFCSSIFFCVILLHFLANAYVYSRLFLC